MLKVCSNCRTNSDDSALWSGSFRRDKSRGLEAVKVDTEHDNETLWQRAPLPLIPTTSDQHVHEHTVAKVKRATGITDCFSSAANTNTVIKPSAIYPTNSFSSTRHISLSVNGLPLSQCLEPHQKYGDILTSLLIILIESPLSGISQRLIRRQAGWESVLLGKV